MVIHVVRPGDSLYRIAQLHGIPLPFLIQQNELHEPYRLTPGQTIVVPQPEKTYIVRRGDTLGSIAAQNSTTVMQLWQNNPQLGGTDRIQPGQMLVPSYGNKLGRFAVNGYAYPSINTNSLNCVLPFLTFLSPFSYKLTPTAELVSPDDSDLIFRAQRSAVMPIMVVTNIFDEGFSTEVLSVILASEELQERLIGNILSELTGKNYYGVNMDIEYIAPDDRERYNAFLERLTERLHNEGFIVMSALAPKISADQPGVLYEAHDYAEQGRIVDYVIIMTYEWGYT